MFFIGFFSLAYRAALLFLWFSVSKFKLFPLIINFLLRHKQSFLNLQWDKPTFTKHDSVHFAAKPSKPEGPLEITDTNAKGCKVQWQPPKDDGGTPIEGYQVEKMDVLTGRWTPVGKVGKDKTEIPVTGLEEGKKYHFRVKAINNEGESDPLETDRTTLAKNPFGMFHLFNFR